MEEIPFLGDIDDELQYSQVLELWLVQLLDHLTKLSRSYPHPHLIVTSSINNEHEVMDRMRKHNADLKFVVRTLGQLLVDITDRRKRLADIAVGLTDLEIDEEGR